LPVEITFDNLQSTMSNDVQEIVEEYKKTDAVFKNKNTRARETKTLDHGFQNSISKQKPADENYTTYNSKYF